MHFTAVAAAASLLVSAQAAYTSPPGYQAWEPSSTDGTDKLAAKGLLNLEKHHAALNTSSSCTPKNAVVRKEWLSLSDAEKIAYTDAVRCLMSKPSLSGDAAPGAKSRYDDFVAVHIQRTMAIHGTVSVVDTLHLSRTV